MVRIWQWTQLPKIMKWVSPEVISLIWNLSEQLGGADVFPANFRKADYLCHPSRTGPAADPFTSWVNFCGPAESFRRHMTGLFV